MEAGAVVVRRRLTRATMLSFFEGLPRCLVGLEACATAHYWGRELRQRGHDVRLMPPSYVKAYLKGQKNEAADAKAICEALTRPSMLFVAIKSCEQQGVMSLHRVRLTLMRRRVQLSNAIRDIRQPLGRTGSREGATTSPLPISVQVALLASTNRHGLKSPGDLVRSNG